MRVPVTHIDPEGYNLGDFIARYRALNAGSRRDKNGRSLTVPDERRAALDALGMVWEAAPPRRPPTDAEITALRALPPERGNIPAHALLALVDAGVEQKALAHALGCNASALNARLCAARKRPAADLPALARAYRQRHGHLRPPATSTDPTDRILSDWLSKQRRAYRRGELTAPQIQELQDIGVEWDLHASQWIHALDVARRYHREHGHLRPPSNTRTDGVDLSLWLLRQRTARRRGTLAPDRVAALDALGMDWEPGPGVAGVRTEQVWQRRFADARAYHAAHGHLRTPTPTLVNGRRLDAWLTLQRARRRQGRLTDQQIAQLDTLGFRW
ncbi:helicase associated domain-containing protein [Streptomyces sp. cg36]|uniref:helicase associated domain-containing protein n=1 Tax=Streptomyces sp. cg36 TaxID=3238798 RepID=UPI0034E2C99D